MYAATFITLTMRETDLAADLFRQGMDTAEIASRMRVTEAEVYNALSRRREQLRQRKVA